MHYLAILVATIAAFIAGGIWYGPVFGKSYRKLMNVPEGASMSGGSGKLPMSHAMALRFLTTLVLTYVLSYFLLLAHADVLVPAFMLAFAIWLGFIATTMMSSVLFGGCSIKLYLINAGNELVGLLVAAAVLTYLPW